MGRPVLFDAAMSPAGRRARMALLLSEIDFELVEVDLGLMDQKSGTYMGINPTGVVPTLIWGNDVIFDSHEIVDFALNRGRYKYLLGEIFGQYGRGALQNMERSISQVMRSAVYETVGSQRLTSRFRSWDELNRELIARGVQSFHQETVKRLFFKKYDKSVVDAVADQLMGSLHHIASLPEPVSSSAAIGYFDICMGPRFYAISMLGLDKRGALSDYISRLTDNPLWKATGSAIYDCSFNDFMETL